MGYIAPIVFKNYSFKYARPPLPLSRPSTLCIKNRFLSRNERRFVCNHLFKKKRLWCLRFWNRM